MNRTALLVIAACSIVVLAGFSNAAGPVSAQPASGGTGKCEALSDFLILNAIVHVPIDPFEARVQIRNVSGGRLRIDPKMFTLGNRDQTVRLTPLTLDETLGLIRNPVQVVVGTVRSGLTGFVDSVDSQRRWAAYAEASIFKPTDLSPERTATGSLFFRAAPNLSVQGALTLTNLRNEAGEGLPALVAPCPVPIYGYDIPVAASPERSYVMTAKGTSGPVTVHVRRAEFAIDTMLTLAIENAGAVEANLFAAAFEIRIVDETGRSYFVRTIRSTLPARVGPRARVEGRLAFDALPPGIRKATLVFPRVRAGSEAYRLEVAMRF